MRAAGAADPELWGRASYSSRAATSTAPSRLTSPSRTEGSFEIRRPRHDTTSTHGTGCTLSSAIAANLALGMDVRAALERAREYLDGAIRHAPGLGRGHGPLGHFWRVY